MNEFKFSCPHCDQHIRCDDSLAGRQFQCPSCNHLIRIPPPPSADPGNYVAESGMTWQTFGPRPITPKKPS